MTESCANPWILIPAYDPDSSFVVFVQELVVKMACVVVVVNDGSSHDKQAIFDKLSAIDSVKVLHHAVNCGKGQALKTGFNEFLLAADPECPGIVTADADGQHRIVDIIRLAQEGTCKNVLTLGVRDFSGDIPLRSKVGNTLTRLVFKVFTGHSLSDTQTGLRYIPRRVVPSLLTIAYTRYEYELAMLITLLQSHEPLREVKIETVYIDNNQSSHFNPFFDSLAIYSVFLRFSGCSLITALIDYSTFIIVYYSGFSIFQSFVCGRIVAGTFNFSISRKFVFRSTMPWKIQAIKYISLVILFMFISWIFTETVSRFLGGYVVVAKIVSELILFFTSFTIQRTFIFKRLHKRA